MTYDDCSTPLCQPAYAHANKRLVYGVGINDYPTPISLGGKRIRSYSVWKDMLARGYSSRFKAEYPTYKDCTVAEEWHRFSVFEKWFSENYIPGTHLDKDLLVQGNQVYSQHRCVFVSNHLNNLLAKGRRSISSTLPMGVNVTPIGKFQASVYENGRHVYQGTFDTPLEAHQAWQRAKADIIANFPTTDPRIRKALDLRVAQLRGDLVNNRITESL